MLWPNMITPRARSLDQLVEVGQGPLEAFEVGPWTFGTSVPAQVHGPGRGAAGGERLSQRVIAAGVLGITVDEHHRRPWGYRFGRCPLPDVQAPAPLPHYLFDRRLRTGRPRGRAGSHTCFGSHSINQ